MPRVRDSAAPIPRIVPPTVDRFQRDYIRLARPVIIEGALDDWPALGRWTADHIRARCGARTARFYRMHQGAIVRHPTNGLQMEDAAVGDFIDGLAGDTLDGRRLREDLDRLPELRGDVRTPAYCRGSLALETHLWITPAGARTLLHWDTPHNLYAHVAGEKTFVLFPPEQTRFLYRYPLWSATPQCSPVDPTAPDLARYPELARARPVGCTLRPGDLLFLPSGWWHYAESTTLTIAVNFWWLAPALLPKAVLTGAHRWIRRDRS